MEEAILLRPLLLKRATELARCPVAGEDLVQDTYLRFLTKPPQPQTPVALHRWMRTVMSRLHTDAYRRQLKGGEPRHPVPLELLG